MKQRTTDANTDTVAAFVEKNIQADSNLLQTYEGVRQIALAFEQAQRGHYQLDMYQVYLTALLVNRSGSSQALKLGAG